MENDRYQQIFESGVQDAKVLAIAAATRREKQEIGEDTFVAYVSGVAYAAIFALLALPFEGDAAEAMLDKIETLAKDHAYRLRKNIENDFARFRASPRN